MVYSAGIQSGQQISPLWERVDWGCEILRQDGVVVVVVLVALRATS